MATDSSDDTNKMINQILIADDDADLRGTIRLLLGKDFDVLEASNGREAVEVVRKELPRLILLDLTMPEKNGIEVLRSVRAIDPSVIVILLTSERDLEVAKQALNIGAAAYVTKPFDMEFLRAEVRRLMSCKLDDKSGRPWRRGT